MDLAEDCSDGYFIITRGKARNSLRGIQKGSVGRVQARTGGELSVWLLGASSHAFPRGEVLVRRDDGLFLSRHQAQLLLFVTPAARRLELVANPQLFLAICSLACNDPVLVKHAKAHWPGLLRKVVQIQNKSSLEDFPMLGFEVELLDSDQHCPGRKSGPLPLFSAGDIVQAGSSCPANAHWAWPNKPSEGLDLKITSWFGSLLSLGPPEGGGDGLGPPEEPLLEVGSMVELVTDKGAPAYGLLRWMGTLKGKKKTWAGVELDRETTNGTDGMFGSRRYFTCQKKRAVFVPLGFCRPDARFLPMPAPPPQHGKPEESHLGIDTDVPPVPEAEALQLLEGRMKGIQGHYNSCYLDSALFSLFSSSAALDGACQEAASTGREAPRILKRDIINKLRSQGFVPAESVMNFRKQLGCDSFLTEEKDPEEFVSVLLERVLGMKPLLRIRSENGMTQDAYTFQIILDKDQVGTAPTVQELLDASFVSCGLQLEETPLCFMVQMPRFGKTYKMFSQIIPSTELDVTDLLHNSPRECFVCGRLAQLECATCLRDRKLQPGRIKQYCCLCSAQVHAHPLRQDHTLRALTVPAEVPEGAPLPRHRLQLYGVLCIRTSHYVAFVKHGPGPHSWLFFDSMADRCGDDSRGFNVPEVRGCPEVGDFLTQPEETQARADLELVSEHVSRLLCDSYMCLYERAPV
ncbi:ubiquitin carboxyl-terminal hydrolase CYLD isoform X1 [Paramormyrops kingsleyae]|uniref:ubiquitin carboxyl-terminal hydrolase CYLD isoform X1 n=1 Tax=Paramormyrops kingsleyae TaxID=1676925 RepID=UPI003B971132